jgi:hypothetical protein
MQLMAYMLVLIANMYETQMEYVRLLNPLNRALNSFLIETGRTAIKAGMRMRNGNILGLATLCGETVPIFRRMLQLPSSGVI